VRWVKVEVEKKHNGYLHMHARSSAHSKPFKMSTLIQDMLCG
jgi:hypothetical protein